MKIRPLAYPTQKKNNSYSTADLPFNLNFLLLSASFINPKTAPGSWWSSKGPQGVALKTSRDYFSAGQKKMNESLASETRPQGFAFFLWGFFWVGQKKNTSREWTECFFWIIPSSDATGKKGAWDGKSGKCPRFSAELFWETKTSHSKKRKCAKVLGSYNDTYGLMTYFEKQPMEKITHSYGMYQENWWFATAMLVYKSDFFEKKKKKTAIKQHWQLSPLGMPNPRSGRILKKPPAEEESIMFWAFKKKHVFKWPPKPKPLLRFSKFWKKKAKFHKKTNKKIQGNEKERHVLPLPFVDSFEDFHKSASLKNPFIKPSFCKIIGGNIPRWNELLHLKANGPGSQNGTGLSQPSIFRRVQYFPQ